MNKIFFVVLFIFSLMFIVNGVSAEGFSDVDNEVISVDNMGARNIYEDIKTTHIRDNYYIVTYTNGTVSGSTNLHARTIEIADNGAIIDNNVSEWIYSTSVKNGRKHWTESFNKTSGLFTITFVQDFSGDYQINVYSMIMNDSGQVHWTNEVLQYGGNSLQNADGGKIINTDNETNAFLFATYNNYNGGTYLWGGYLLEDGTFDFTTTQDKHCSVDGRIRDFLRVNGKCSVYLYDYTAGYYRYTDTCNTIYMAGGGASLCGSTAKGTLVLPLDTSEVSFIDNSFMNTMHLFYGTAATREAELKTYNYAGSFLNEEELTIYGVKNTEVFSLNTNALLTLHTYDEDYVVGPGDFDTTELNLISFDEDANYEIIDTIYYDDEKFFQPQISNMHVDDYYVISYLKESSTSQENITIRTITTNKSIIASPLDTHLTIQDERTLEDFDMTDKTLTFYAHCADNVNYQKEISSNDEAIPVTCNYDSFSINVGYELEVGGANITYSYKRFYIRELDPQKAEFDLDVYLINPLTTDYVENEFKLDFFTSYYEDSEVYFEKNINGLTTQITADSIDIRSSMRAVLMNGESYYLYIKAPTGDKNFIGEYLSPQAGVGTESTTLNLFDIRLTPTKSRILNQFDYQVYGDKETGLVSYIVQTIDEVDENLINMTLDISDSTSIIYNVTKGLSAYNGTSTALNNLFSDANINFSAYRNETLSFEMMIAFVDGGEIRYKPYKGNLWIQEEISIPIMNHITSGFMDWVILVFLSVIAVYATIKSANIVSIIIVFFAAMFSMFGWFTISSGALGLAIFVAILSLLTKDRSVYP